MRRSVVTLAILLVVLQGIAAVSRAGESALEALDRDIRELAAKAGSAVVRVSVEREIELPGPAEATQPFLRKVNRIGTGFVVDRDGHVLTTHQLVEGAENARIRFASGEDREATVLGSDPFFKVAVLRVRAPARTVPLTLRDDDRPGFACVTVFLGHSFGSQKSVGLGLVTGNHRSGYPFDEFDNYVTVNATVNPGDTGGPFLDAKGRVIGMAVETRAGVVSFTGKSGPQGGVIRGFPGTGGPAYAIPASDLRFAMDEIRAHGRVRTGRLGVLVWSRSPELRTVHPGTPAARAGLKSGDSIRAINDRPVSTGRDLSFILRRTVVGKEMRIHFRRGDKEMTGSTLFEEYVPPTISPLTGIAVSTDESGVIVRKVDSRTARFSVKTGDRVIRIDEHAIQTGEDLSRALTATKGRPKRLLVVRGGLALTLTPTPRKPE
jgi:serine protease Do